MRLDDYIEIEIDSDESYERRRLAKEKSYEILDYLTESKNRFEEVEQSGSLFGSTSPSVFVGRSNYPRVSAGLLSPVAEEEDASEFSESQDWYERGLGIDNVLQYRTGLLNSDTRLDVEARGGFVDVQQEVALADRPVDVEIQLDDTPDFDVSLDQIATPTGPRATADEAELTENPHVPRSVEKVFGDDDWKAEDAMTYLYDKGFDVYEIDDILSAGALGQSDERKLVPTRWSITAVDDAVGSHIRHEIKTNPSVDSTYVWENTYMGNRYWVILSPGQWEFELVEIKSPGSIWNPSPDGDVYMASAHEGYDGRTTYVDETAGAYYASRIGALDYLRSVGRQAKCLVIREVTDDYWAPVGVWQIRESVRNAFEDESGVAETFPEAIDKVVSRLPVSTDRLRRKSTMVSGLQTSLDDFF
ncbi:MAG: Nre family DNA repair protein [Halobacteria archaeon]|nr:Nre family DNA repair protein [Halobacteria archaeon]